MINLHNCLFQRDNGYKLEVKSLNIQDNSTNILVGPSGSGKTTLLNILCTIKREFEGELLIDTVDSKSSAFTSHSIMFLSQELGLWENMTVIQHINFVLNHGKSLKNHPESQSFLEMVKLIDYQNRKIDQLSIGQKQRVALARALSAKAKYLFLDEPFANIDIVIADELMNLILEIREQKNFSIILASHQHFGFKDLFDQIIILDAGKIVQQGTYEEVSKKPTNEWTKKWLKLIS